MSMTHDFWCPESSEADTVLILATKPRVVVSVPQRALDGQIERYVVVQSKRHLRCSTCPRDRNLKCTHVLRAVASLKFEYPDTMDVDTLEIPTEIDPQDAIPDDVVPQSLSSQPRTWPPAKVNTVFYDGFEAIPPEGACECGAAWAFPRVVTQVFAAPISH